MRFKLPHIVFLVAVVVTILVSWLSRPTSVVDYSRPYEGTILIDLDDSLSPDGRRAVEQELVRAVSPHSWRFGLGERVSEPANLWRAPVPESEVRDVLEALNGLDGVQAVEIEQRVSLDPTETFQVFQDLHVPTHARGPNDPYYRFQWHLDQINAPEAWETTRGQGIVVAVIDTGVAYRTNDRRFPQAPDLDRTAFVPGWDFVDNDPYADDENGHGTHVAGTIAQSTNNGKGVAGVAPEATIMPLRVLNRHGSGSTGDIAAAIRWAADHGAHVINMSLGGGGRSAVMEEAIEYAHRRGVVIIAAAGNASRGRVEFPAAYDHVISVSAVRYDRTLSFYSSYGPGLDIAAPGGDMRVDQNGDGMPDGVLQNTIVSGNPREFDYLGYQGTSMATPHVAGVAALIMANGVRDPDEVEHILKATAVSLGDANQYGAGLVQADAALRYSSSAFTAHDVERVAAASIDFVQTMLLLLGCLFPLAACALLLHFKQYKPLLVGLCWGVSLFLLLRAVFPLQYQGLPFTLFWVVPNAFASYLLGKVVRTP